MNDMNAIETCNERYKEARRRLRSEIKAAKAKSWNELIEGIDRDLWGLPYKMAMGKLRRSTPMLTETLGEKELEELLRSLFSTEEIHDPVGDWADVEVPLNGVEVSSSEVRSVLKKGNPGKAPGPDGVTLGFLRCIPERLVDYIADTFTTCFAEGMFPREWKKARLVLIPKGNGTQDGGIKARPRGYQGYAS